MENDLVSFHAFLIGRPLDIDLSSLHLQIGNRFPVSFWRRMNALLQLLP